MKSTIGAICILTLSISAAYPNAVYTDPVGAMNITLKGESDTRISIPFFRSPVFEGKIESISGNEIQVSGTPAWAEGQFLFGDADNSDPNNTYFVLIMTGAKEGLKAQITASTSDALTIDPGLESLTGIQTESANGAGNGDIVQIVPYHTLATVFGDTTLPDQTSLFFYNTSTGGFNKSPNTIYTYFSSFDAWGDGVSPTAVDHTALIPTGAGFVLRLPSSSSDVDLIIPGAVPMSADRKVIVLNGGNVPTDKSFGLQVPIPVAIGDAGLDVKDQTSVFVYDNDATGINKSPVAILTYFESFGEWGDGVSPTAVSDTYMLQPGYSYVVRVPGDSDAEVIESTAIPSYLE